MMGYRSMRKSLRRKYHCRSSFKSHQQNPAARYPLYAYYSVVEVIAPLQNLIPAVESVATKNKVSPKLGILSSISSHTSCTLVQTSCVLPCRICTAHSQIILHIAVTLLAYSVRVTYPSYRTARAMTRRLIVAPEARR